MNIIPTKEEVKILLPYTIGLVFGVFMTLQVVEAYPSASSSSPPVMAEVREVFVDRVVPVKDERVVMLERVEEAMSKLHLYD
jgi:hypothetical protein